MHRQGLNRDQLVEFLSNLVTPSAVRTGAGAPSGAVMSDVHWNLQMATSNQVVFYHLNHSDTKTLSVFAERLEQSRCGLVIVNDKWPFPTKQNFSYLVVNENHFKEAQKRILDLWYPMPTGRKLVGITGTNGKTTTAYWAQQIALQMGHTAAALGTLGLFNRRGELLSTEDGLTTPSYIELRKILYRVFQDHEVCFMEVSSHALSQDRLYKIPLSVAAWTSFTQDHLDFHKTLEHYFEAKAKIAEHLTPPAELLVPGEERSLIGHLEDKKISYTPVTIEGKYLQGAPPFLAASFNQKNLTLAYQLNKRLWGKVEFDVKKLQSAPGRFEVYPIDQKLAVIDFAHTPDALEKICQTIRSSYPDRELWVLFGCGGNRDRSKRPMMGEVASRWAQKIIVTSDNPRDEEPEAIISAITSGIHADAPLHTEVDRKKAIHWAIKNMGQRDILLVAGKGHEQYQTIKGEKIPFSDKSILLQIKESLP